MALNEHTSSGQKMIGIALSGGVDSATAAFLLKQAGYDLIGFHMHLTKEGTGCNRACCSLDSAEDARRVAGLLDMPFYVLNMEEQFKREVVEPSRAAYRSGRTPNPCVLCNQHMKFKYLLFKARELGCEALATGHYVRKTTEGATGEYSVKVGMDPKKDQSYFLYFLNQELLSYLEFPLGWFTKEGTRAIAKRAGLKVAAKPDSQDICFHLIEEGDISGESGTLVDEEGIVLGRHEGVEHYTVGQRKGLGIALGYPLYVKEIRPESREVVIAPDDRILAGGLVAARVSLVNRFAMDKIKFRDSMVRVKVRSRAETALAKVEFKGGERAEFEFIRPVRAVCPGQAVVMYMHDEMLGGGIIEKATY
jgi:tRNA-specific 2-thiouridylase